jgi:hypothetical protein
MRGARALAAAALVVAAGCAGPSPMRPAASASAPAARSAPRVRLVMRELRRDGAILFADEGVAVREAVATRLAAAGWDVVPIAEVDRVAAGEADGRCQVAPSKAGAWKRAYGRASVADPDVSCRPEAADCELLVTILARDGVEQWRTPVPRDASLGAVAEAAVRLERAYTTRSPGHERPMVGFAVDNPTAPGVVLRDPAAPGAAALLARQTDLDACLGTLNARRREDDVRVLLDARGQVQRCEVHDIFYTPASAASCLCRVASATSFGPGADGRRLAFRIHEELPPAHGAGGVPLRVELATTDASPGAPTTFEARLSLAALATCFEGATVTHAGTVSLVFTLHPSGAVTHVALDWPAGLDAKPRACVEALLAGAAFPCAAGPEAKVYADLRLAPVEK